MSDNEHTWSFALMSGLAADLSRENVEDRHAG